MEDHHLIGLSSNPDHKLFPHQMKGSVILTIKWNCPKNIKMLRQHQLDTNLGLQIPSPESSPVDDVVGFQAPITRIDFLDE